MINIIGYLRRLISRPRPAPLSADDTVMAPSIPERSEWLLLALAPAEGAGLTPVQLQKVLFVFGERMKATGVITREYYNFRPYHFGPFDGRIYSDAEFLQAHGLVAIEASLPVRTYALTPEGQSLAKEIAQRAVTGVVPYLTEVVRWAQRLSFSQLVRSIYEAFPEMRENSVFRDAVS